MSKSYYVLMCTFFSNIMLLISTLYKYTVLWLTFGLSFFKDNEAFLSLFLFFWKVMEKYLVPDYTDVHEFLSHLGKRLGKLKKGKIVKLNVWNEWSKNYSILLGLFMLFEW